MSRIRLWILDALLTVGTVARGLSDDPLHFLLLAGRRLRVLPPPKQPLPSLRAAYRWYLADRPDQAAAALRLLHRRPGLHSWLASHLEVELGLRRATSQDSRRLQARSLAQRGELSAAIEVAPSRSRLRRRLASERESLTGGGFPSLPLSGQPIRRVLMVLTNSLPYTHSGYTHRSHQLLTALQGQGLEVSAVTRLGYPTTVGRFGAPPIATVDGVRYHRLPTAHLPLALPQRLQRQTEQIINLARRYQPELLHCTTDYTNAVVTAAAARSLGVPWVYEMRGQLELTWITSRPASQQDAAAVSERVRMLRAKEAELANQAAAVIVLSHVQRAELVSRGVAAAKIHVVPNAAPEELLTKNTPPALARKQLGLPAEGFWVGSVSSLVAYEGFDTLLRAVAHCRDRGLDVRCALVGDGAARPELIALAQRLGLDEVTVFPGRVPAREAINWHQALDLFAAPRQDQLVTRVVTPLKPIEAMALGRPVVASDLPALAELVSAPGSGLCFPAGDVRALAEQIVKFALDPELYERAARAGRQFAAGRTWAHAAKLIQDSYQPGNQ